MNIKLILIILNKKIVSDKKLDDEQDEPIDHLKKRLRHEIQMYNRMVAAKQKQEDQKTN